MSIRIFDGELIHQNPICTECNNHCFSLYIGGRKDKLHNMYFCKRCQIIYKLPAGRGLLKVDKILPNSKTGRNHQ